MSTTRRRRPTSLGKLADKKKHSKAAASEDELLESVPGGLVEAFVNARLHDKNLALAGLGEPSDWNGDMPELPEDIAAEDHNTLSNLLRDFAMAHSTAVWWASKAYIEHGFYEEIVEYLTSTALMRSDATNDTLRKAAAATDETVVTAKALQQTAYSNYVRFRDLGKALKIKHSTVSRIGGFVGEDVETEDQDEAPSRSTRGRSAGHSRGRSRGGSRMRNRK